MKDVEAEAGGTLLFCPKNEGEEEASARVHFASPPLLLN